jgi:hypothetical protein
MDSWSMTWPEINVARPVDPETAYQKDESSKLRG